MSKVPARFNHFRKQAETLLQNSAQNPGRLQKLLVDASRKQAGAGGDKLREMRAQLSTAIALVRAWLVGDYRQVSNKTLVILLAALLYFVMPLDVVPDFLLGWGLLDDAAVLGYAFSQLQSEIAAFQAWREQNQSDES